MGLTLTLTPTLTLALTLTLTPTLTLARTRTRTRTRTLTRCAAMRAWHAALDPSPWLKGVGAALGVWLVGSLPPHAGPLGEALRCAAAVSLLVDIAGASLG